MQRIILEYLEEWKKYKVVTSYGDTIGYLYYLINDSLDRNISYFLEWIQDPSPDESYGNILHIKKNKNMIYIGSQFSDTSDDSSFFILAKDEFVSLLDQWQQETSTNSKKIIITEEHGIITVKSE